MITIEKLFDVIEQSSDNLRRQSAELLVQALNDWRLKVNSIEDYSEQLKKLLDIKMLTKDIIEQKVQHLNPEIHAWEMESATSLIEAFNISGTNNINSLLEFILETIVE